MDNYTKTSHDIWDCKYHIVFIPKYRQKRIYGELRNELKGVFQRLVLQKECRIEEGHMMKDHVHVLLSIPPKYSVSHVIGFLKGKSELYIGQRYGRRRKYRGYHFWARGYYVSTVGHNEEVVRRYIRNQEVSDKELEQQSLFVES